MKARFLGTGASGGTPGDGRSSRFESSLAVSDRGTTVLIDVTRHFGRQSRLLDGIDAVLLPHAREAEVPTYAYRIDCGGTLVYASDVARLTAELRGVCAGADILVIDGAMWRRKLFSHLTIDAELSELCRWEPARILLTQIGRTAPPHEALKQEV